MAFVPDAAPTKFVPDAPPVKPAPDINKIEAERSANDHTVRDAALKAVGNVPMVPTIENTAAGVTGGLGSLFDALTGAPPGTHNFTYQPRTPQGQEMQAATGAAAGAGINAAAKGGGALVGAMGGNAPAAEQTLQERIPEALGAVGTILGARGVAGIPSLAGAGEGAAAAPVAVSKYGFRTLADHPVAAGAAGPSGAQAVALHNQPLGNTVLGAEAGVPHGTPLVPGNKGSLAAGREAPGSVYDRMEASLPTAPLSPAAAAQVQSAGTSGDILTAPAEATQATIDAQKAKLTQQPLTGTQVVQTSRALRQEGGARIGSEDPEQQKLGAAQLQMARALEQHMTDTLPPNAPVSLEQFQAARKALAKNYTVQGALKGGNVDMQAIARADNADPNLFDGPMKDIADFASQHPAVTRLTNGIEVPPSVANDIGQALRSGGMPQDLLGRIFGASGVSALARARLLGDTGAARFAAQQTPVSGLAGEFSELPMNSLHTPGRVGEGPSRQTPLPLGQGTGQVLNPTGGLTASTPQAPPTALSPGGIPLADLLSQNIESNVPPRLGIRQPIPDQRGSFSLRNVNNASGQTPVSEEFANAQDADRAGGVTRSLVDLDGRGTPLSGVAARDVGIQGSTAGARVGSGMAIEERPGEPPRIINRGNLSQNAANGLLNRYLAMRGLGGEF